MKYNPQKLKADLITKRCIISDLTLSQAAIEIGISKATLSRLENKYTPDVLTLGKCCAWLGTEPNHYFEIIGKRQDGVTFRGQDIHDLRNSNNYNAIKKETN